MNLQRTETPRYLQIATEIENELLAELPEGGRLPSTAQLAEQYGVNRLTVREALAVLSRRGLVESHQGVGTFSRRRARRYEVATGREASLSEQMRVEGRQVRSELLASTLELAPRHVCFDVDGPVRRIDTFRLVDDRPWSLTSTWFHPTALIDIEVQWPGEGSLSGVLRDHYGLAVVRDQRSFAAIPADARASEYLGIELGWPVLRVRGTNVDAHTGRVLIGVEHRFAGDAIEFVTRLR